MVKGKTSTGFEFEVDKEQMTNVEFLERFAEVQEGNNLGVFKLIETTMGKAQKKKLYDHCRNEKGMVPIDRVNEEVSEIFAALAKANETKN